MESKKRVTVYLSQEALIQLRKQAKDKGTSRSVQLENLVLGRNVDVTYNVNPIQEENKSFQIKVLQKLKNIEDLLGDNIKPSESMEAEPEEEYGRYGIVHDSSTRRKR